MSLIVPQLDSTDLNEENMNTFGKGIENFKKNLYILLQNEIILYIVLLNNIVLTNIVLYTENLINCVKGLFTRQVYTWCISGCQHLQTNCIIERIALVQL